MSASAEVAFKAAAKPSAMPDRINFFIHSLPWYDDRCSSGLTAPWDCIFAQSGRIGKG
jgi:hypothetical protein